MQQLTLVEAYGVLDGFLGLAFMIGIGSLLIAQSRGKFAALGALAGKIPPALWLFIGALLLRLINIDAQSLWYDEVFTARVTSRSIPELLAATAGDVHPPGFYLTLWPLVRLFGDSELVLRLPAAVFGALAAVMVYRIATAHEFGPRWSMAAGVASAILPGLLYYGQEARMYALLALLLLLAYWAASEQRWTVYTLAAAAALWTHNFGLLYIGTIALAGLMAPAQERRRLWIATALAGLLWAPWTLVLARQLGQVAGGFWIPALTWWRLLEPLLTVGVGYTAPSEITLVLAALLIALVGWALCILGRVIVMAARAGIFTRHLCSEIGLHLFLLLPLVLAALASLISPVYLARGFIASGYLLPVALLYPLSMSVSWVRPIRWIVATALLVGLVFYLYPVGGQRYDSRSIVQNMDLQCGDTIYHTEIGSYMIWSYYTPACVANYVFPYASDLSQTLTADTKAVLGFDNASYDEARQRAAGRGRLYAVLLDAPLHSAPQAAENIRLLDTYLFRPVADLDIHRVIGLHIYEDVGIWTTAAQ